MAQKKKKEAGSKQNQNTGFNWIKLKRGKL